MHSEGTVLLQKNRSQCAHLRPPPRFQRRSPTYKTLLKPTSNNLVLGSMAATAANLSADGGERASEATKPERSPNQSLDYMRRNGSRDGGRSGDRVNQLKKRETRDDVSATASDSRRSVSPLGLGRAPVDGGKGRHRKALASTSSQPPSPSPLLTGRVPNNSPPKSSKRPRSTKRQQLLQKHLKLHAAQRVEASRQDGTAVDATRSGEEPRLLDWMVQSAYEAIFSQDEIILGVDQVLVDEMHPHRKQQERQRKKRSFSRSSTSSTQILEAPDNYASKAFEKKEKGAKRRHHGDRVSPLSFASSGFKSKAKKSNFLHRSSTTVKDSIGSISIGASKDTRSRNESRSIAGALVHSVRLNRVDSDVGARRTSAAAATLSNSISCDDADWFATKASDLNADSPSKKTSSLPPAQHTKAIKKAKPSEAWTKLHNRLIEELFEESRRAYVAKQVGGTSPKSGGNENTTNDQDTVRTRIGSILPGSGSHEGEGKSNPTKKHSEKTKNLKLPPSGQKGTKWLRRRQNTAADGAEEEPLKYPSLVSAFASVLAGGVAPSNPTKKHGEKTKNLKLPPSRLKMTKWFRRRQDTAADGAEEEALKDPSLVAAFAAVLASVVSAGGSTYLRRQSTDDAAFATGSIPLKDIPSTRATGDYKGPTKPNPGNYLHPKCQLQKDKNRGEVPGSIICAVGREKTIEKIRQKVDVIIEVEQSSTATTTRAKLKLKPAICAQQEGGIIETRSVMSVKMGFLSMKYGALLRWDEDSSLVTLVVLRKLCTSGFMEGTDVGDIPTTNLPNNVSSAPTRSTVDASLLNETNAKRRKISKESPSKFTISRLVDGSNAILCGRLDSDSINDGTEVAHIGPPYRVDRPETFPDAVLSVAVLNARGLYGGECKRSDWTMNPYVRLSVGSASLRTKAAKMTGNPTWNKATENSCKLVVEGDGERHLKVEVLDWRPFGRDRILGVVFVPVTSVEPQKSLGKGKELAGDDLRATEVTIPVRMIRDKKGPFGCVTLSLVYRNDHLCWLREELKARGRGSML